MSAFWSQGYDELNRLDEPQGEPMIRYPNGVGEFLPHTHDTYLHAGAHKKGWPADHSVDDTYECPPHTWKPADTLTEAQLDDHYSEKKAEEAFLNSPVFTPEVLAQRRTETATEYEYRAVSTSRGANLDRIETKRVRYLLATFNTYADAVTAAEALNNHEGY